MVRAAVWALCAACAGSPAPGPRTDEAPAPMPPPAPSPAPNAPMTQAPRPAARHEVIWPPECGGEGRWDDPQAPPPDPSAPMEIAVVTSDVRFAGRSREPLLRAVESRLRTRDPALRLVRREEVARAEGLVTSRRWSPRGPVCGQPPPLPALLAERHPNLALANVVTLCEAQGSECWLQVLFSRAGADDAEGLPESVLDATLSGPPTALASWVEAAGRLDTSQMGGLMGYEIGSRAAVIVRGNQDDDPWLRLTPTLDLRADAIAACAPAGISSFRLRWTISPTGEPGTVEAMPATAPASTPEALACLARLVHETSWPCPRSGAATPVELTVCVRGDR